MTTTVAPVRTPAQITMDARVLARVQRGIELLQDMHGPDWADHITPERLDIRSGDHCVLGQVYGGFEEGLVELGLVQEDAFRYGFYADAPFSAPAWDELNEAWRHVLVQA